MQNCHVRLRTQIKTESPEALAGGTFKVKLRVGIIMGGKSAEKEVSFNSGRTVCDHLDTMRYELIPLFQTHSGDLYILPWHFLHRGKISDFEHRLGTEAQRIAWDDLKSHIDFAYIAVHGRYAEDGTLQGFLEILRIPYLGSKVFASALGMDKDKQKDFLRLHGLDAPKGIVVQPAQINNFETHKDEILKQLTDTGVQLPYIVKPYKEGSSLGVSVVFDHHDLHQALMQACTAGANKEQTVLIEEKIQGMEFSCIVITDYKTGKPLPLPPTEVVHPEGKHFFDYEQKYMPGKAIEFTPPRIAPELIQKIQDTCVQAMHALEFTNLARIDGFVTRDGRILIIDPNTLSGMGPASFLFREAAAMNISHTQLINHLIETELAGYGMLDAIVAQEKKEQKNMNIPKTRVAVLMGGPSNEKEISLESGRNVTYKLSPQKYEAIPLFVSSTMELYPLTQTLLVRASTHEIEQLVDKTTKIKWDDLPKIADFVFIALHGGEGENGSVQGALEMLGMPYNGSSVLTSALCMDKYKTTQFLHSKGFAVPQSLLIAKNEWLTNKEQSVKNVLSAIPFPLIVKPHDDGCSVMVHKVRTATELSTAIETLFASNKEHALIEECVMGMELTVGVVGNDNPRALPPSQAVCQADILSIAEKFLPGAGENQTPAPLPKETLALVQRVVADTYKALGCKGYSRIDCFYQRADQSPTGAERVVILENNSLPGLTPATCIFHQAAEIGMRPMEFIDLIVQLGLEEHAHIAPIISKPSEQSA